MSFATVCKYWLNNNSGVYPCIDVIIITAADERLGRQYIPFASLIHMNCFVTVCFIALVVVVVSTINSINYRAHTSWSLSL